MSDTIKSVSLIQVIDFIQGQNPAMSENARLFLSDLMAEGVSQDECWLSAKQIKWLNDLNTKAMNMDKTRKARRASNSQPAFATAPCRRVIKLMRHIVGNKNISDDAKELALHMLSCAKPKKGLIETPDMSLAEIADAVSKDWGVSVDSVKDWFFELLMEDVIITSEDNRQVFAEPKVVKSASNKLYLYETPWLQTRN